MESERFLNSLKHTNSNRPSFSIKHRGYTMLEISMGDQTMQVPMAEILNFADRWRRDYEQQLKSNTRLGGLSIFPYPLYNTSLYDPDCMEVSWDIQEPE